MPVSGAVQSSLKRRNFSDWRKKVVQKRWEILGKCENHKFHYGPVNPSQTLVTPFYPIVDFESHFRPGYFTRSGRKDGGVLDRDAKHRLIGRQTWSQMRPLLRPGPQHHTHSCFDVPVSQL